MRSSVSKFAALALLSCAALVSTGCMTHPGDLEHVGAVEDPVQFSGYVQEPNKWVEIQARSSTGGRWATLGWTRSGDRPYHYSGRDWYAWNRNMRVPMPYWNDLGGIYQVEVRAVDYTTRRSLYTFDATFTDYFDPWEPLQDLFSDHGAGTSATIYAL